MMVILRRNNVFALTLIALVTLNGYYIRQKYKKYPSLLTKKSLQKLIIDNVICKNIQDFNSSLYFDFF